MKFLVAVDGSPEAGDALAYAIAIADAMDATITAVHAVDPDVYDTGGEEPESRAETEDRLLIKSVEDAEERGLGILDDAASHAEDLGRAIQTRLLYGEPVEAITGYADDAGFDAIFVGHRGRSERTDLMLGSTAKTIVERSPVPVTVTR